ncbi:hypothetical protein [Paenibacillus macerans]|uniref:hypothetical protein n=1 Tax=Paenibacillus macerans TaxID=44252 RepID=UPI003D317B3B
MKKIGVVLLLAGMLTLAACGAKNNDMNGENMTGKENMSTETSGNMPGDDMSSGGEMDNNSDMMKEEMNGEGMMTGDMGGNMGDREMKDAKK